MFWMSLLYSFVFFVVGELLRPKPKIDQPKPSALGDFSFPTATEGRAIPVVWGTVRIKGPNVVWYGHLRFEAITKKQKTGLFSSTRVTVGYKYHLGMHLALCHGPIDEFIRIGFDGKPVTLTDINETTDRVSFKMQSPQLFGKPEEEGGVTGPVTIYKGTFTQSEDGYLQGQLGFDKIPAYRPICHAVFNHCYLGNRNTVSPVEFDIRRTPNPIGLLSGKHNVNGDANPACMLYECMTDLVWGEGIPVSLIDINSFIAVGNTLYDEGLGLSMQVDSTQNAEDLRAEILRHVDGVIYPDPETGLFTVALARDDYDVETLPVFDESNIDTDGLEFNRSSWGEVKNTIQVKYIDRDQDFAERVVQQQNLAVLSVTGGQVTLDEYDYLGISNMAAANNVIAPRVLKTVSSPLATVKFTANRDGAKLRPAGVFKLTYPSKGIAQQVFRVTDIDYGTLDEPEVEISAVEDIFSVNSVAYAPIPGSAWVDPKLDPLPMAYERLEEVPYGLLGVEEIRVMTLATRAGGQETGYYVYSDKGVGDPLEETNNIVGEFTPSGDLLSDLAIDTTDGFSFTVDAAVEMSRLESVTVADRDAGRTLALVDGELIAWQTITDNGDGTFTFGNALRAVYDTVPAHHAAGARVFFVTGGAGLTQPDAFGSDVSLQAKLLSYTPSEILAEGDATPLVIATNNRAERPYAPGLFRVNGQRYPAEVVGPLTVTWAHRDRLAQGMDVIGQDDPSVGPEAGVTYTFKLYDSLDNVLYAETGIAGTTPNGPIANSDLDSEQRVEVKAVRDGLESRSVQEHSLSRRGWGFNWGEDFGGIV